MFLSSYLPKKAGKILMPLALLFATAVPAMAEGPKPVSSMSNPFVTLMVIIIIFLAIIIFMMARLVTGTGGLYLEKWKKESEEGNKKNVTAPVVTTIVFLLMGVQLFAQDKATVVADNSDNYGGISSTAYYLLSSVVFIELLLIGVLLYMLRVFAGIQKKKKAIVAGIAGETVLKPIAPELSWWDKFNALKPLHQEVNIDLGHDYDGIRELDNRLPPWWVWGFVLTIAFAGFYLYTHYISHTAPSSIEEYQASVKQAEIEKAEYLKKSANNVDETNVKLLTSDADLAAGKQVFQTRCFVCHGKSGEGLIGPNLTDDYWLHGGSVQDVFKTIKYGWVDKGMQSWKDEFSPVQLEQIASYVKSLRGTNPPNARAPQGTLYVEAGTAPSVHKDSVIVKKAS